MTRVPFAAIGVVALVLTQNHPQPHGGPGPQAHMELQNEAVEVVRIRLAPHERLPMHEVTPRVVVWLTDAHLRDTFADGTTREVQMKAGEVGWVPAQQHAGENLGDQPVEFVAIVPKGATHRSGQPQR
jgi:quercetin dioxygenase-like cupin family protein